MTDSINNEVTPIDIEIKVPTIVEEEIQVDIKVLYNFIYKDILEDEQKLKLFNSSVQYIKANYQNFDSIGKISGVFVVTKLLIINKLTEENMVEEINKFFNDLNVNYNTFVSNLYHKYSKTEKLIKFSNNYLLENNYDEQVYQIQQNNQDIQQS